MNTNIQIFKDELFKDVRVIVEQDNKEPLFCLIDVASNLEYSRGRDAKKVLNKEYGEGATKVRPLLTNGGEQLIDFIDEEQLYFLIMRSNKECAKKFRRWICKDVLPSIRKHGAYINNQENKTAEQLAIDITKAYTSIIQEKTNKLISVEESLKQLQNTVEQQQLQLKQQQEEYDNLNIEYTYYRQVQEQRFRSKIQKKEFIKRLNSVVNKTGLSHQFIYGKVYRIFFSAHNISESTRLKYKNTIDLIFSKKEWANDAFVIISRFDSEPDFLYS